jgi:arylsulfatase A-like enzyme
MKHFLRFLCALLCQSLAVVAAPNILLILADDMGYADLGVTGAKDIPTPHLDALAKSGTRLTDAYVTAPYCAPSRAGLLTGRAGTRYGFEFNTGKTTRPGVKVGLPAEEVTIAERLRGAGYRTGLVGKWHLGGGAGMHPLDQGFDEFFGILGGGSNYFGKQSEPLAVSRNRERAEEGEYLTDAFGREAAAFVANAERKPWFLYLSFNAVHTPMQAKEADLSRVPNAVGKLRNPYAAMLVSMDDAVGRVLAKLRETGADKNTLVIFLSDNGGPTAPINSNVNGSRNDPYRGGKRQLSEGGIRTPLFVSWPGVIPAGKTLATPVTVLDLAPTLLAAADAKGDDKLEGVNLLPHLRGEGDALPTHALCWRFGLQFAVREGDWKLVRWKHDDGKGFTSGLFNLRDDPAEAHDQSAKHPDIVARLAASWQQWNAGNVAPAFGTPGELTEAENLAADAKLLAP